MIAFLLLLLLLLSFVIDLFKILQSFILIIIIPYNIYLEEQSECINVYNANTCKQSFIEWNVRNLYM